MLFKKRVWPKKTSKAFQEHTISCSQSDPVELDINDFRDNFF